MRIAAKGILFSWATFAIAVDSMSIASAILANWAFSWVVRAGWFKDIISRFKGFSGFSLVLRLRISWVSQGIFC